MKFLTALIFIFLGPSLGFAEEALSQNQTPKEVFLIEKEDSPKENPLFHAFKTKDPKIQKMILSSLAQSARDENEVIRRMAQEALMILQYRKHLEDTRSIRPRGKN